MEKEWLCIGQTLEEHPILAENIKYRIKYLNFLEYFLEKYSKDDIFAKAVFKNYISVLLEGNVTNYCYQNTELKPISKGLFTCKIKKFKFFSYRFLILIDCLNINAFFDKSKAENIFNEIKGIYNKRYHKKLDKLFKKLYIENKDSLVLDSTEKALGYWKQNRDFIQKPICNILVTANMSAGKSTLLNAIIGKKVSKTQNDACTAKVHFLMNKAYEDKYSYEWDYDLNLSADYDTLMTDNDANNEDNIIVATYFNTLLNLSNRLCFIDTPGVNSSLNLEHKTVTQNLIETGQYDKILYVLNGENIGTYDDINYLRYIKEKTSKRIIFVVNKLDRYKIKEDSIENTLEKTKKDLIDIGFENPIIYPISAYAGYLAKMKYSNQQLNEDEIDELEMYIRKFKKPQYNFSIYYPESVRAYPLESIDCNIRQYAELMVTSGLYCLENIIYKEEKGRE